MELSATFPLIGRVLNFIGNLPNSPHPQTEIPCREEMLPLVDFHLNDGKRVTPPSPVTQITDSVVPFYAHLTRSQCRNFSALAATNMNHHALTVDVTDS
jgi:hypothetical protein